MDTKFASLHKILNNWVSDFKNKLNDKDDIIKNLKLHLKGTKSEIVPRSPTMFERLNNVTTPTLSINQSKATEYTQSNESHTKQPAEKRIK